MPPEYRSRTFRIATLFIVYSYWPGRNWLPLLAAVAGQAEGDPHEYVAGMLWRAGWARPDGTPLERWEARAAAAETYVVLVRLAVSLLMPIVD